MPSWAKKPSKLGFLGGVVGGVMGGLLWHIYDPPRAIFIIEAVLLTVTILLLAIPHSPQTPNLNPIIQLINAH